MPLHTATEFQRILAFVRKRRAESAEGVCIGKTKTWDDYRHETGYIKALDEVETEMRKITGSPEASDERDV